MEVDIFDACQAINVLLIEKKEHDARIAQRKEEFSSSKRKALAKTP